MVVGPAGALSAEITALPGILFALVEEVQTSTLLVPESAKLRQSIRGKFCKRRLVKGTVVASGERKRYDGEGRKDPVGQPPPPVGTVIYAEWGKACLTIHPRDDIAFARHIPEGFMLQAFGMWEPWDEYVLASDEPG